MFRNLCGGVRLGINFDARVALRACHVADNFGHALFDDCANAARQRFLFEQYADALALYRAECAAAEARRVQRRLQRQQRQQRRQRPTRVRIREDDGQESDGDEPNEDEDEDDDEEEEEEHVPEPRRPHTVRLINVWNRNSGSREFHA